MKNRLVLATLLGAFLGIFCIVGIGFRLGFAGNEWLLFSAWYNRLLMGLIIGLAYPIVLLKSPTKNSLLRGLCFGFVMSYAWYLDTGFRDLAGFFAGLGYGIIIDFLATKYSTKYATK